MFSNLSATDVTPVWLTDIYLTRYDKTIMILKWKTLDL